MPDYGPATQEFIDKLNEQDPIIEDVKINFTEGAIKSLAAIAVDLNEKTENIGARRLHTVMERLLEDISFNASDRGGEAITIDKKYVAGTIGKLAKDKDLSQYIL